MRFQLPTIIAQAPQLTEARVREIIVSDPAFEAVVENSAISTLFEGDDDEELGIPAGLPDGFTARYTTSDGSGFVLVFWDEGDGAIDEAEWRESPVTILFDAEGEQDFVTASELVASVTAPLGLRVNAAHFDSWLDTLDDDAFDDGDIDYVAVAFTDPLVLAEWRTSREAEDDAESLDAQVGGFPEERAPGLAQEAHPLPKVCAVDIGRDGAWAGLRPETGELLIDGKPVPTPSEGEVSSLVRIIDDDAVFVLDHKYGENAWIVTRAGEIVARWSIPPGMSQVVVTDDYIVVGWGDEGVYHHGGELGENGLAAFTFDGDVALRYRREIRGAVGIDDLYAMAPLGGNRVAFSAYTGFEYVELDIGTREHVVRRTPSELHYSRAITSDGISAWFLSRKNDVRRLNIESGSVEQCGRFPDGTYVRGIAGGRFLSEGTNGYTIVTPGQNAPVVP